MRTIRSNCQTLPLTTRVKGKICVPSRSGINWGQRPGRNENQAYLAIPAYIQRAEFFPTPGTKFYLEWDDGISFICVRAQFNGKAIQTPENNAALGYYLRNRLDVKHGDPIVMGHLFRYGRIDIDIYKESGTNYFADFSKPRN